MDKKTYVRGHPRRIPSSKKTPREDEEHIEQFYKIVIDKSRGMYDREKAVDELKRLARTSPLAHNKITDMVLDKELAYQLRKRAEDC